MSLMTPPPDEIGLDFARAQHALMKERTTGILIAGIGTLLVTPDAALLRIQHDAGGSTSQIAVWRYGCCGVISVGVGIYSTGGAAAFMRAIRSSPWLMVACTCLMVIINYGFTLSLLYVDTAKALLLISLNPLWAALMGFLLLGDTLPHRTIVAQALSLASIVLMVTPDLLALCGLQPAPLTPTRDQAHPLLPLVPLVTGIFQATLLILARKFKGAAAMEAVPASGAFLTCFVALVEWCHYASTRPDIASTNRTLPTLVGGLSPPFFVALVVDCVGLCAYNAACAIAPRYITSAETGLILLGESVGGPLWMFLIFGLVPSPWTLAAATLLVTTLVGHELLSMRANDGHALNLTSPRAYSTPGHKAAKSDSPPLEEFLLPTSYSDSPVAGRRATPGHVEVVSGEAALYL